MQPTVVGNRCDPCAGYTNNPAIASERANLHSVDETVAEAVWNWLCWQVRRHRMRKFLVILNACPADQYALANPHAYSFYLQFVAPVGRGSSILVAATR
jgi:hypothetical protein